MEVFGSDSSSDEDDGGDEACLVVVAELARLVPPIAGVCGVFSVGEGVDGAEAYEAAARGVGFDVVAFRASCSILTIADAFRFVPHNTALPPIIRI